MVVRDRTTVEGKFRVFTRDGDRAFITPRKLSRPRDASFVHHKFAAHIHSRGERRAFDHVFILGTRVDNESLIVATRILRKRELRALFHPNKAAGERPIGTDDSRITEGEPKSIHKLDVRPRRDHERLR